MRSGKRMATAVEFAKGILQKEEAIRKSQSEKLKRDFEKSAQDDRNELAFYCRNQGLPIREVFEEAKKGLQSDTI